MEFIFILLSWMMLLVPGFDDSVPPTGDKIFKIETSPDIVESIKVQSDESFDLWGFDIVLKQNSTGILEIKIPKNLPTPASFSDSWYHDERAYALANGTEINYDAVEDPCYSHYRIPIEGKTNVEIVYSVIAAGSWKLYSPIQFDKDNPCYSKVFYEKPLDSPLKQFKSGIAPNDIICKDKFQLALNGNGHPVCIKDTSTEKLSLRNYISDLIIIGIPHALPVIDNAEIESMVELFQNRYHTSQITYAGPKIILNATNVWGETIFLVMQSLDDGITATLTCNHNDWRKQEIITENVLAHLQNKNCFAPALEETTHKNNAEPGPDYDSNDYNAVFDEGSPIQSKKTGETVLDADNCKRYAYWLTKYQKEKIVLYEDYPRYPPWGNEIFPLVNYCVDVGDLAKTVIDGDVLWRFQLNEN